MSKPVRNNHSLLELARILRRNMTRHEKRLWYEFLRHYPIKIYKQRTIDSYIVDFYCPKARLVIELDGSQHYTTDGKQYDSIRSQTIEDYGLRIIRFTNLQIDRHFDKVCYQIDQVIRNAIGE